MATSRPRETALKEKKTSSASTPHSTDASHVRRTTRPSVPGLPDRENAASHRRPTMSSLTNVAKQGKSPQPSSATAAGGSRLPTKKPTEKPPSPSRQPQRALTPPNPKERTAKTPSPLPRAGTAWKPVADKPSKSTTKTGKSPPLLRSRSFSSTSKKKEADGANPNGATVPKSDDELMVIEAKQEEETPAHIEEDDPIDVVAPAEDEVPPPEEPAESSAEPKDVEATADSAPPQAEHDEPISPTQEPDIAPSDEGAHEITGSKDENEEGPKVSEETLADEPSEEPKGEMGDGGKPEAEAETAAAAVDSSGHAGPEKEKKENEVEGVTERISAFKTPTVVAVKKEVPKNNDVIEETKSKLLGSRKSKVRALVGAFETVMSSQEPEGQSSQTEGKGGKEGEANGTKEST